MRKTLDLNLKKSMWTRSKGYLGRGQGTDSDLDGEALTAIQDGQFLQKVSISIERLGHQILFLAKALVRTMPG